MAVLRRGIWQPTQRQWHGVPFEVDLSHPLARGLVGYWLPMASAGGSKLVDLSGYTNHGAIVGSTWIRDGKKGQTLSFDGSNDYVDLGDDDNFDDGGEFSWSFWVNINSVSQSVSNGEKIFYKIGASGDRAYQITFATQASVVSNNPDADGIFIDPFLNDGIARDNHVGIAATDLSDNEWHHIVFIYSVSNDSMESYLGGVLKNSISVQGNTGFKNTTVPLTLGSANGASPFFGGLIDEVRIYNRALTAAEIQQIYQNPYALLRPKTALRPGKAPAAAPAPGTGARMFVIGPGISIPSGPLRIGM